MDRAIRFLGKEKASDFLIHSLLYFLVSVSFITKFKFGSLMADHMLWTVMWVSSKKAMMFAHGARIGLLIGPILTLFRKTRLAGQLLTVFSALILVSLAFSNGKSYHTGRSVLYFFTFFLLAKPFLSTFKAAHMGFFAVTTIYINSGLWKLKFFFSYLFATWDFSIFPKILPEHIAGLSIELMVQPTIVGELIFHSAILSAILWALVIIVELSPVLLFWFPGKAWFFSLALACLHVGVIIVMRIQFIPSIFLLLVLAAYFYINRGESREIYRK